jgi:hypothetical protein
MWERLTTRHERIYSNRPPVSAERSVSLYALIVIGIF